MKHTSDSGQAKATVKILTTSKKMQAELQELRNRKKLRMLRKRN